MWSLKSIGPWNSPWKNTHIGWDSLRTGKRSGQGSQEKFLRPGRAQWERTLPETLKCEVGHDCLPWKLGLS